MQTGRSNAVFLLPWRRTADEQTDADELHAIVDKLEMGLCIVEVLFDYTGQPTDYVFLRVNDSFERQTGLQNAVGKSMRTLRPGHEQHWFDMYGKIAMTGESSRFLAEAAALGRWYDVSAFRIGDAAKHRVVILFDDVTERRRLQRQHELLSQETDHRARNMLGLVAGLVRMTAADSVEDYKRTLLGRLDALARSQRLLSDQRGGAVDFAALAKSELEPYQSGQDRIRCAGPAIMVDRQAAQCLAMTLHELATNAVKYGALSTLAGMVQVNWREQDGELHCAWEETGGPELAAVRQQGVGTTVMERCIGDQLGGRIDFDWRREGLACRFCVPLRRVSRTGQ